MIILGQSGKHDTGPVKHGNKIIVGESIMSDRIKDILNSISQTLRQTKAEYEPDDFPVECEKEKLEDKLELEMLKKKLQQVKAEDGDFTQVEEMEKESSEMELMEYKYDFYQMSLGSIMSIAKHAQAIVDALENPSLKERLTESWLQGKIAVTEDYMITIHNFLMFGESETDTEGAEAAKNLPGLWENIRKKKERMGKKYKPAKPGDKDRPDPEQWKKLTK